MIFKMNILESRKPKAISISKWLKKNKGGNWIYDGTASWWCDDNKRHVSRVAMDCMEEDGPVGYYLYGCEDHGWVYFT